MDVKNFFLPDDSQAVEQVLQTGRTASTLEIFKTIWSDFMYDPLLRKTPS